VLRRACVVNGRRGDAKLDGARVIVDRLARILQLDIDVAEKLECFAILRVEGCGGGGVFPCLGILADRESRAGAV
jgi:hypothetical protein